MTYQVHAFLPRASQSKSRYLVVVVVVGGGGGGVVVGVLFSDES